MRPFIAATFTAVSLVTSTFASVAAADEPKPTAAALAPASPPSADTTAEAHKASSTGGIVEVGSGAMYIGGQAAQGANIGALELIIAFRGGYYFTEHFGVLAGIEGGYGYLTTGCSDAHGNDSDNCNAFAVKVPIMAQYALQGRRRGVHFDGGVSTLNLHAFAATNQVVTMFSPVDVALGIGMRVPMGTGAKDTNTLDIGVRGEAGMFTSASVHDGSTSASGDIDQKALHYAFTLGFGRQF